MPDFELHADFDRDGVLSGSQRERDARLQFPGAIVVPNLDNDRRGLSGSVGVSPVPTDAGASLPSSDDELVRLEVRGNPAALAAGERLELRVSGVMHVRVIVQESRGGLLPHVASRPEAYSLPNPTMPTTVLWLSVRTIAGARFDRISSLSRTFTPDTREERDFRVRLVRIGPRGSEREEDSGSFTVAPVIFDDRLSPVRRLYIVDSDDNLPTRIDLAPAVTAAGVSFVRVPSGLTSGDTWFQDQYQHGYMEGPTGTREIVVHLPRLRKDSALSPVTGNLATVIESDFRGRDVALYSDLWDRVIVQRDIHGRPLRLSFRGLSTFVSQVQQLERAADLIDETAGMHLRRWRPLREDDWINLRRGLPRHVERLKTAITEAQEAGDLPNAIARDLAAFANRFLADVVNSLPLSGSGPSAAVTVSLENQLVTLAEDIARRVFDRAEQMHSGKNYGGNIEATPPAPASSSQPAAPLGKIIIGNAQFEGGIEAMDPDLLNLLAKQRKQPIVEIDTTWLRVGHVDEMLSVVPTRQGRFAFVHASSAAALAILRRAEERHLAGRGATPPAIGARRLPHGSADRLMDVGTAPVTRLLRGQAWLHSRGQPAPGRIGDEITPPSIYRRIAAHYGSRQLRRFEFTTTPPPQQPGIGYLAELRDREEYLADITPIELLFAERDNTGNASSNETFETTVLAASRQVLGEAFPGIPVFSVPVLFDRIDDCAAWIARLARPPTRAFTPNMANMQVLNGHIVVPRPYGPRMRPVDAVAVVRQAMVDVDMPNSIRRRISTSLIASFKLAAALRLWTHRVAPVLVPIGSTDLYRTSFRGYTWPDEIVAVFRDSFPGANANRLNSAIITPNPTLVAQFGQHFSDPMRIRFNDGMVDLFELWMAAVAAELGAALHFVDTWFYHLHDGQIHCGTNVLHGPPADGRPHAHEVSDTLFRTRAQIFDEGENVEARN